MLQTNTSATGSLNIDAFERAMLIYRNSIDPETKTSPAMVLFGRQIRDPIPAPLGRYCPHQTWKETLENREKALAIRHSREREKWSLNTKELNPLNVGDHVYVQNLVGNNPLKWEKTGLVIEALPYRQYKIKLDGTGRITLRNRKGLRKFTPFYNRPNPTPPQEKWIEPNISERKTPKSSQDEKPVEMKTPETRHTEKEVAQPPEVVESELEAETSEPPPVQTQTNTFAELNRPCLDDTRDNAMIWFSNAHARMAAPHTQGVP